MGRRSTVDKLPDAQRNFVIAAVAKRHTDRQISADFEEEFGASLPTSSLNYWRRKYGNKLAETFGLQRALVQAYIQDLKEEGVDVESDKYGHIIENLEDGLLTRLSDLVADNPLKMLAVRQEDEKIKVKREQIELNRQKLEFDKQKHEREASVRVDRLAIGAEVWKFILFWCNDNEPHVADALTRRSADILAGIEGHLENEAS